MASLVNVFAVYTNHTRYLSSACVSSLVTFFAFSFSFQSMLLWCYCIYVLHMEKKIDEKEQQRRMKMLIEMFISACYQFGQ